MAQISADVVVIGGGPAGYVCAIRLSQLGRKVTVIDEAELGGVCLNRGCIPSKALIYAGSFFEKLGHASEFGIELGAKPKLSMPKLMTWKEGIVKKLTGGVGQLLKANGATVIAGRANFTSPTTLTVTTKNGATDTLNFKNAVIATGSRPTGLKGFDIDQDGILDSTGALLQQEIPESMLCIGGGYIGLELGTFYAKAGTKVTVVEPGTSLLASVDPELSKVVHKKLTSKGVEVKLGIGVKSQKKTQKGFEVEFSDGSKGTYRKILVTIGRTPNTNSLGLDKALVALDAKGFIKVDAARRTNQSHIFAIGDVAGQPLLAHKGSKEGVIAAEVLGGLKSIYDVKAMPAVIFTDPEIAAVGYTEAEAKAEGIATKVGVFPFAANGRALSVSEPDGFVKMIGDAKTGKLLGVHIVGAEASNLIAEAALAIEMGAQVEDLALTVHAHPTLPETMMEAAEAVLGHAIHIFQKKPTSAPSTHA